MNNFTIAILAIIIGVVGFGLASSPEPDTSQSAPAMQSQPLTEEEVLVDFLQATADAYLAYGKAYQVDPLYVETLVHDPETKDLLAPYHSLQEQFGQLELMFAWGYDGVPDTEPCQLGRAQRGCASWLALPRVPAKYIAPLRQAFDNEHLPLDGRDMLGKIRVAVDPENPQGPYLVLFRLASVLGVADGE